MTEPGKDAPSEAEEQIRLHTEPEQLQHADRLAKVGQLAAGIIHELGTPLNVIGSYAQMIATREVTGDEVVAPARAIEEQVTRISQIVRRLLDFARRNVERTEPVELLALAQQTASLLAPFALKAGARLSVESDAEGPLIVDGSAGLLQQVLVNLVTNAIQAMPQGGKITIEVDRMVATPPAGGPERPYIRVAVQDEGVGIPADKLDQLFEPFFTTKEAGHGTGLGLAVCSDIVDDHHGWMDVDTERDVGVCVYVILPEAQIRIPA